MSTRQPIDLNLEAHIRGQAEQVFLDLCGQKSVGVMLDVGANSGQFGLKVRERGFSGLIISYEPQLGCRSDLAGTALTDKSWIVMPNMGAGSTHSQLSLNITANSFSSSFFPTHENHLRAEPLTKAVRKELVPVFPLSTTLPPEIACRVGAMKIDTQGFELEVLKGLGDAFPCLSVIQVELSAVECYVGAPSLEEVDHFIQNTLGFRRVLLEPTYYDNTTGELQQYDGVYLRDDTPPALKTVGLVVDAVVTSIGKPYLRPDKFGRDWGQNWSNSCTASWKRIAPSVLSISEVPTQVEGVKWISTKNKPRMIEFLKLAEASTEQQFILTNADVLLSDSFKDCLPTLDPDVFYYGHRMDVKVDDENPQNLVALAYYIYGYDYFIIPKKCLAKLNRKLLVPAHLRIGEPWWDYALPLLVMHMGYPCKKLALDPAAAVHFHHQNSSSRWWIEQGLQFLQWCKRINSDGNSPIAGLLNELEPTIVKSRTDPEKRLLEAARLIVAWMT